MVVEATEALVLRPLPRGELLLHLNLSVSTASLDLRHLDLFPRAMAELVLGTGVAEAHLSLARGRWLDSRWGAHPEPAPTGAAVWAWLPASTHQSGWGGLRRALGAVVCAGLQDDMDVEEDAEDVDAAPDGSGANDEEGKVPSAAWGGEVDWRRMASPPAAVAPAPRVLRRAMTAREGVCTENLAALAQLWPCHDAAGVAQLLASDSPLRERLLRPRHSSLRLRLLRTCAPDAHDGGGAAAASRGDARGEEARGGEAGGGEVAEVAEAAPAAVVVAAAGCRPRLTLQLGLTALLADTTVPDVIAAIAEPTAPEPTAAVMMSATSASAASAGDAARRGVRACPLCMSSWLQLQLPAGAAVHVVGSSGGASRGGSGAAPAQGGEENAAAAAAGGEEAATAAEAVEAAAAAAAAARVWPAPTHWARHVAAAPEWQQLEWRLHPLHPAPTLQLEWRRGELPRVALAPLRVTRRVAGRELQSAALVTSLLSQSPHPIEVHYK